MANLDFNLLFSGVALLLAVNAALIIKDDARNG